MRCCLTLLIALLLVSFSQLAIPQIPSTHETRTMSQHATGTFEIKLTPETLSDTDADRTLARMSIRKTFHGPLDATSSGEMLSAMTATKGSAGYVAIEHVVGTLAGHTGTFVLQHSGLMDHGTPSLTVNVVPDSGTGALAGLAGAMSIVNGPSGHTYDFTYTLPQP